MDTIINRAIEAIYECALNPAEWPVALQHIADCFDDGGCILIYGRNNGAFGVIGSPGLSIAVSEYVKNWSGRDIRAMRARERGFFGRRVLITDSDVVSPEEIESHPFYAQFLRRFGLRYFAGAAVVPGDGAEAALSVQRAVTKRPYTAEELSRLDVLGRHAERALGLGLRLADNELASETLGHILSRIDIGVFVLDALGRVTFSNIRAQNYIGDGVELVGEKLHLRAKVDSNVPRLHTTPLTTLITDRRGPILVYRQNSSSSLIAHVLPVEGGLEFPQPFMTQARLIVLLSDTREGVPTLLARSLE